MSPVLVGKLTAEAFHLSRAGVIHADGSQDICKIVAQSDTFELATLQQSHNMHHQFY